MTKISLFAKARAAEGKADELKTVLSNLIAAADEEPGLEVYSVHIDPNDPLSFSFFELYTDSDAFAVHGKGDKMRAAMGALGPLMAGRPEITILTPHAAKGLDI